MKKFQKVVAIVAAISCMGGMPTYAATAVDTSTAGVTTGEVQADAIYAGASEEVTVNVSQGSTFTVEIPKTIALSGAKGAENSAPYTVTVTADIPGDEFISVVPDSTFKMSSSGKEDIDATVTQAYTDFGVSKSIKTDGTKLTMSELMAGVSTDGKVAVENLTSGKWTGSFDFAIAIN